MLIREIILEDGEAPIHYLAYGMLTDPELMPGATLIGKAVVRNFAFELLSFANVFPQAGSQLEGSLWAINRKMMAELDRVEGYPDFYDRKTVPAYCQGTKYEANIYTMTPESRDNLLDSQPSEKYIQRLVNGYRHAGISLDQIRDAI
jgi:gamma-glutamylcyclotransferase (GGCT)/AIG2-like uncharacterized protein YtfP